MQEHNDWRLTIDTVARYPRPGTVVPGNLAFSPDGRLLTYLFSERGDLIRDLWALDLETGTRRILVAAAPAESPDAEVSREEALRRERLRLREGGITTYRWADKADRILLLLGGRIFVTSSAGEEPRPIAEGDAPVEDARLSADGRFVVFVRERDLWAAEVEGGRVWRLTEGATDTLTHGLAEYIAQEEMGRGEGFWISPDATLVAFEEADEGHVPVYPIVHQGTAEWSVENHRYHFPGQANARVRLGIVPLQGGEVRWLDLGADPDIYLARVDWQPDGKLAVQIESRHQRRLDLWRFDPETGARSSLLAETSDVWINLHHDLRFLEDGTFIWASERSGYKHLYLHGSDGAVIRQLTDGAWPVDAVFRVDEAARRVYFSSGGGTPVERHLYAVSLDGGAPEVLTSEHGYHGGVFAPAGGWYGHTFESRTQPPSVELRSLTSDSTITLHQGPHLETCAPGLAPPEIVQLTADDGTELFGALYHPVAESTPHPVIVSVYGGPHAQTVTDTWGMTVDLRAQYLASLGFLVFKLDNRGSARRGLAFEAAIKNRMGTVEVQDQVRGVEWLVERGLGDPNRVGIYGWSYGGYMTAMCLLTAPNTFRAGVAGAPVTDWDGYDTHYTERYMETPATNPDGYRAGSALTHVDGLRGKLLLVHGMVDENVHFRHTARLITALEAAGRPCDLLILPGERHMPRDEAGRRYMEEQVASYFTSHI